MAKKKSDEDISEQVDRLIEQVSEDRDTLVTFLNNLISSYDGEKAVGIAEYVAKIADALTRQHQVKASVVKTLSRLPSDDDAESDLDELSREIGLPFTVETVDDGSN